MRTICAVRCSLLRNEPPLVVEGTSIAAMLDLMDVAHVHPEARIGQVSVHSHIGQSCVQTDEGNGADEDVEPEGTEGAVGVKRPNDPVTVGVEEIDVSFEDGLAGVRCCPCRRPLGSLTGWREVRTSGAWGSALDEPSCDACTVQMPK